MNTRAAVIGWGTSGKAAAAALAARGWEVVAYDSRHGADPHNAAITVNVIDDPVHLAATVIESQPQLIVVSPGIPAHAPIMAAARDAGIPLWGEVELAWHLQEQGPHAGRDRHERENDHCRDARLDPAGSGHESPGSGQYWHTDMRSYRH